MLSVPRDAPLMRLDLLDGFSVDGFSFGANRSVSGELVFQTGMVGYPESLTDPSYRGQILVCTFPLVGNYGVPSRSTRDRLLPDLPAFFESSEIHVAGLVVASYTGEDYSHFLAASSLGTWLKENDVPAIYSVDTRALTKRIRSHGSMLGCLRAAVPPRLHDGLTNGDVPKSTSLLGNTKFDQNHVQDPHESAVAFQEVQWCDQNKGHLVRDGIALALAS